MNLKEKIKIRKMLKLKKCRYCLATKDLTIDHKIPYAQGGTDDLKNLQCLCARCNGTKSGLSHRQIQSLFKWFRFIEASRALNGSKPIFTTKKEREAIKTA